ncbi:carbamoyltransferase HypF [Arcobacteraceae bacterium]|nr:carbamoyltransferase HypF [Arcobacteraceae bacterium]
MIRCEYNICGIVQGVGFRPFIYKLANELSLSGYVLNNSEGVKVEIEGFVKDIELFDERLISDLPPLARIDNFEKHPIDLEHTNSFEIIETTTQNNKTTLVSADVKVCDDCIQDIKDTNKYKNYFATNCTNCGPRYSIIKTVPYDRVNTSMSEFIMCDSCKEEYTDPNNRRYHAQPVSCNDCGPKLSLLANNQSVIDSTNIYKDVARYIQDGKILAIKGIGGFHLICDATNDEVVSRLRSEKNRPSKPFAIMCKDTNQVKTIANLNSKEKTLIESNKAPIVILDSLNNSHKILSEFTAPCISKIGVLLPYTPLHIMIFEHLNTPIIATSANLGGEPVITTKEDIYKKLPFVDFVVDFNRDIINAVDDSLVQVIANKEQVLRIARGYAPKVIKLKKKIDKKILAVGANAKNTIAIAFEDTIIISPHIGDLDSLVAFEYFIRTIETFKRFYDFEPDVIIHDMHPNYETTKWAKKQDKPLIEVQHHLAHIYTVKAEYALEKKDYIGFSFDGTGYGLDKVNGEARDGALGYKTLWGGEVFINDERTYHFKYIKLLGGAKAIKEPRRVALAMLFEKYSLEELETLELDTIKAFTSSELKLLHQSYLKNINSFDTSSVGRLFDAIASFSNISQVISYEGESGLLIESYYDEKIKDIFTYTIIDGVIDIKIVDFITTQTYDTKLLCCMLINTLCHIVLHISSKHNLDVILTGGVFQNKTLLEKVIKQLEAEEKKYFTSSSVPTNDAGISLGQIYYSLLNSNI